MLMVLVLTHHMRIRDDPIGQVFPLRHRGFDRVSADCRAGDRVGPKKNRR